MSDQLDRYSTTSDNGPGVTSEAIKTALWKSRFCLLW
jgi:hypothetical protein